MERLINLLTGTFLRAVVYRFSRGMGWPALVIVGIMSAFVYGGLK